jgi:hypothetical protein
MCQSKTVVLPSPFFPSVGLPGTTSFSFALLNLPFLIENSKPLHSTTGTEAVQARKSIFYLSSLSPF